MNKDTITVPIINIIYGDQNKREQYMQDCMAIMKLRASLELSSLNLMKKYLGNQKYCLTCFVKNYVWESDNWRVYASKRGFSFEVLPNASINTAYSAWKNFHSKFIK